MINALCYSTVIGMASRGAVRALSKGVVLTGRSDDWSRGRSARRRRLAALANLQEDAGPYRHGGNFVELAT